MPAPLVPDDDLYARLELELDASPEAIELAWRALLKQHHPDVAGDGAAALERAKRINVAHDWLADPSLRARYDRERAGVPGRRSVRDGGPLRRPARPPRAAGAASPARPRPGGPR
ncbi:MAG TPA: DnaJ domain-containing protein, partial [Candidatus Limnocylindrales bacterium]